MIQHDLPQLGSMLVQTSDAALIALMILAAWIDIKSRRIPNWLVVAGLAASFGIQLLSGDGGLSAWSLGFLVGFGLFFPLYLIRAMGAGDVKLIAMAGAFIGPSAALGMVLMTLLAGGILAIAGALWTGVLRRTLSNVRFLLTNTMLKTLQGGGAQMDVQPASVGNVPYSVAIAAGTIVCLILERSGHALFA